MPTYDEIVRPDFVALAAKYSELVPLVLSDGSFDFSHPESAYVLNCALLREFFGLDVHLDRSHLCPRLANRLDYAQWIVDIVKESQPVESGEHSTRSTSNEPATGLDIGVGASAIYPLLVCSLCPEWRMVGTDINPRSIETARSNVVLNSLDSRIDIIAVDNSDSPLHVIESATARGTNIDFTMCNPPFYSSLDEMMRLRAAKQMDSRPDLSAVDSELFTAGGEELFVERIFQDSLKVKHAVLWYTTMVGKKDTAVKLVELIGTSGVSNYILHEIAPAGSKTRRWVVGWSFRALHPRDVNCRIRGSGLRLQNRQPVEIAFPVQPEYAMGSSLHDLLPSVLSSYSPEVTWSFVDENTAIVRFSRNVWSRAARRAHQTPSDPTAQNAVVETIVQLEFAEQQVNAWWRHGVDYKLFESFVTKLSKTLK